MVNRLYVLGHPVGHSKSPVMHNAAYAALGLDWEYGFADCERAADARSFIGRGAWLALNITMPYKPLALECAEKPSAAAVLAHGANVLVHADGALLADNVDGKGCVSFLRRRGVDVAGKRVAVCGTGPTSLSIMHASAQAGAQQVTLLGRDGTRAQAVLDAYRSELADALVAPNVPGAPGAPDAPGVPGMPVAFRECRLDAACYADAAKLLSEADVIVDATPLGMNPGDPAPFDTAALRAGQVVVDVVYGHGETALVAAARAIGATAYDGSGMLVGQAVETILAIANATGLFSVPEDVDLHAIMARAAGFAWD